MISDRIVKDKFFEIENDEDLLKYEIRNISVYLILRFKIEIFFRNNLSTDNSGFWRKVISKIKLNTKLILSHNHLTHFRNHSNDDRSSGLKPGRLLFVSTSNWTFSPGESIELVDIIKYYKSIGEVTNFIQPNFNSCVINKQDYHDGFYRIDISKIFRFSDEEILILSRFFDYLGEKLGCDLKSKKREWISYIGYVFSMADQLLAQIRDSGAKIIFARSIYTEPWVKMACIESGSMCVEVQHGVVGPENIYYTSPNDKVELIFPDFILTYSCIWRDMLVNQNSVFTINNAFIIGTNDFPVIQNSEFEDFALRVVFCLQNGYFSIDDFLFDFLLRYGEFITNANVKIVIRPHPSSVEAGLIKYHSFLSKNVVLENPKITLSAESLASCDILVSATSMMLYEAMANGIYTISFNKYRDFTIPNGINFVSNVNDLYNLIDTFNYNTISKVILPYLSNFNTRVLDEILDKIK